VKKVGLLSLTGLLLVCMLLFGCAQPTEEGEPGDVESGDIAPDEVIELDLAYHSSENIPPGAVTLRAGERIEELSNGRVKINNYFSASLLTLDETLTGVSSGMADIALVTPSTFQEQFDLISVFQRPFIDVPSLEVCGKAFTELLDAVPEINEELAQNNIRAIGVWPLPSSHLHSKQEIRVPDDLKGLRINLQGDVARWFESMGAVPVQLSAGDMYMAMERGVTDGIFCHWSAFRAFALHEVTTHNTVVGGGANLDFMTYIINLDTWNSLPADIQEIIVDSYRQACEEIIGEQNREIAEGIENAKASGNTFIELTPEELELWQSYVDPVNEAWIEKAEAKGLPARETFEQLKSLLEKYNK
jgi:TRAP-type C4-dicarboxylate transport system substrate-binding protein